MGKKCKIQMIICKLSSMLIQLRGNTIWKIETFPKVEQDLQFRKKMTRGAGFRKNVMQ